jgi:cytochrome c oxidase cbb3-type subunit III
MRSNRFSLVVAITLVAGATHGTLLAQAPDNQSVPDKNPLEGRPDAIQRGMGLFRSRCSNCHGMDARGTRGPDLTQVWESGRSDAGLFRTIRDGVPGTEMPAVRTGLYADKSESIWSILAYVRTIAAPAPSDPVRGNAEHGERVFRATCSSCHRVNGRGGRLGPDLSRVGSGRARVVLVRRIRGAVEDHAEGYEPVTLVTPSGQQIQAAKKNEDLFSIQVMDTRERIQGYLKTDMKEVKDVKPSLMPTYDVSRLSESDLDDVLAYLATLKGSTSPAEALRPTNDHP